MNLIRLMAECDANYIRLLRLMPQIRDYLDRPVRPEKSLEGLVSEFYIACFKDIGAVTVQIKIVEAFKYTTTVLITQKPEIGLWMTNPSMLVRLYHDADNAEVISCQGHRNFQPSYPQPNPLMYQPDEKLQVNIFLGEWLSHCLKVGRSTTVPEPSVS